MRKSDKDITVSYSTSKITIHCTSIVSMLVGTACQQSRINETEAVGLVQLLPVLLPAVRSLPAAAAMAASYGSSWCSRFYQIRWIVYRILQVGTVHDQLDGSKVWNSVSHNCGQISLKHPFFKQRVLYFLSGQIRTHVPIHTNYICYLFTDTKNILFQVINVLVFQDHLKVRRCDVIVIPHVVRRTKSIEALQVHLERVSHLIV